MYCGAHGEELQSQLKMKISEKEETGFCEDVSKVIETIVDYQIHNSPFKYKVVRNLSCLNHDVIHETPEISLVRFK